jgi:two-component system, cell cycle sensor histidine kinase and response regulator CckA
MVSQLDLLHVSDLPRTVRLPVRSPWVSYAAATVATLVAAGVSVALYPGVLATPMAPFALAVIVAAWLGGLGPAVLATVLSICSVFLLPYTGASPAVFEPSRLVAFAVICLGIGLVAESLARARRQAVEQAASLEDLAMELEMANQELTESVDAARQSRELAEDAELRYRLLFDRNPVPLWVYDLETLAFLAVNDAAVAQYGFTRAEFLRMTLREIRPPEDIPALLESHRTGKPGLAASGLFRHRRKDGSVIAVDIRSHDMTFGDRPGRLVLATDVTEQVRARDELQSMNERLRVLVEASPLAIVGFGVDGTVRSWNPAAQRMFGWTEDDVVGRPAPFDSEVVRQGHSITGFQTGMRRRDGSAMDASVSGAPLRNGAGDVVGFVGVYEDVTERRRTERALQTSEEQLRQAQKMEAVGRLAGGVAHDFNNILTTIQSYTEFLTAELGSDSPHIGDLKEIEEAAVRASGLTRQLLAFSRKEAIESQSLDLNEIVTETERMLRRVIGEDIELVTRLDPALGRFEGDRGQFSQLLMNLAVNARDAMPDGGRLLIETSNVELDDAYISEHRGASAGPHILLSVSDTGIGMDAAIKSRIFEPFFTTKEQGKGTGLGLSMVYGFVQQSGGSIWVYSEPDEGTTFKIYLPRVADVTEDEPVVLEEPASRHSAGVATILLVEDESAVRRVAKRTLAESGYTVLEAANGREALAVAAAHRGPIDLVLTDMVMPEMRGGELATRLREVRPESRLLMMSGYTEEAASRRAILEAGSAFLEKPFTASRLLERVHQVLGEPEASPAARLDTASREGA